MVKELKENRVNPSLRKSSVGRDLPLTNNSRGQNVTDMNGYNKAWPVEADDEKSKVVINLSSENCIFNAMLYHCLQIKNCMI